MGSVVPSRLLVSSHTPMPRCQTARHLAVAVPLSIATVIVASWNAANLGVLAHCNPSLSSPTSASACPTLAAALGLPLTASLATVALWTHFSHNHLRMSLARSLGLATGGVSLLTIVVLSLLKYHSWWHSTTAARLCSAWRAAQDGTWWDEASVGITLLVSYLSTTRAWSRHNSTPSLPRRTYKDYTSVVATDCTHRNVLYVCPLCPADRVLGCRGCHDAVADHALPDSISLVMCAKCGTTQSPSHRCEVSTCEFHDGDGWHAHYCHLCHAFSDTGLVHCDACGFCRVASDPALLRHCDKCQSCVSAAGFETHYSKCLGPDRCAVCLVDTRSSSTDLVVLERCSHVFHAECLSTQQRCPMCRVDIMRVEEDAA